MTRPPVLPTHLHLALPPLQSERPSPLLPPLWSQLAPHHQQQLAQHLAELIRRIRLQAAEQEVNPHAQR